MSSGATARDRDRARLRELIEPVVNQAGFDLEDVVVTAAGRRSQARVVVDGDDGVSLDDIALLSKTVSAALDQDEAVMGSSPYTLEVTSPGVDRPLTTERHWRRAVGRLVRFTEDQRTSDGRVLEVLADEVVLDVDGQQRRQRIAELSGAQVQVEFSRPRDSTESAPPGHAQRHGTAKAGGKKRAAGNKERVREAAAGTPNDDRTDGKE